METTTRQRALAAGAALILGAAVLAAVLPSSGTTAAAPPPREVRSADGEVVSITLPDEDPTTYVPPGPHREQFTAQCRLCHSPRLVLTQPRLPEKNWAAVVHKMVATYGAELSPDEEKALVEYLVAVRGPEPPPTAPTGPRQRLD